jgi:hypothetical protein
MRLRGLHSALRPYAEYALRVASQYGVPVEVTSVYRSMQEQRALRDNYEWCLRTGRFGKEAGCMYPANKPGDSSHNFGLSWDSTTEPRYQAWWDYVRRAVGFEVLPNDRIHAQLPSWRRYVA